TGSPTHSDIQHPHPTGVTVTLTQAPYTDNLTLSQLDSTFAYSFIVSDIPATEKSAVEVEHFHRRRAQIEERFKDAKRGQALTHLPSGKLAANRLWLCCTLLALNVCAWVCDISPAAAASGA